MKPNKLNLSWSRFGITVCGVLSFQNAQALTLQNLTSDDVDVMNTSLVTLVNGNYELNGSQTFDSSKNYILTAPLFVTGGNQLTIPAGTSVYSTFDDANTADKSDDDFGALVVTRGSQLIADGEASAPIVFTTIRELEAERSVDIDNDASVGPLPTRADRGLWGGVVLLGNAKTYNYSAPGVLIGENVIEGFASGTSPDADNDSRDDIIEYGGSDDADNSGTLRYVSIRHGGYEFETDSEVNGLTLGGVGSGTTLEYIEVLSNSDDGIEFFGGTANLKYALVSFVKDDGFDLDEGYTGKMQYVCVIQNPSVADSSGATVQDSDHGGEWDGNNGGDANDFQSAPVISNLTFIGDNEGDHAFKIDDFFAGSIYNGAVSHFADLIDVTSDAVTNDTVTFENVTSSTSNTTGSASIGLESILVTQFTSVSDLELNMVDVAGALYDPRPSATSPLLTANAATVTDLSADAFFEVTDYQGAFSSSANWALGWTGTAALGHFTNASESILQNLTSDDVDVMDSSLASFDASLGVYVLNGSQTLDASKNYILTDSLFVMAGDTLTIPAGTTVYSTFNDQNTSDKSDDEFGGIVVARGGMIDADGEATAPIVFTTIRELEAERSTDMDSDSVVGPLPTRADRGLWGGVVLLGNAKTYNYSAPGVLIGENVIEGFSPAVSPDLDNDSRADIIEYGGSDDEDNSGTLRYVSIRHGGYEFETDSEVNGLTLGGVGSGTTLEYIEVLSNSDDGIEFFGGTANLKYGLVAFVKDDGFDLDEGYTGKMQYVCVIQNPSVADSGGATVQDSDHGGEWDGNNGGDANDFQSAPVISNLTFIGDNEGDHAFKIDDFFAGSIYNGAISHFADLIDVTSDAVVNDTVTFENVTSATSNTPGSSSIALESILVTQFTSVSDLELTMVDVAGALYDPRPSATSPLLTANAATVTDLSADDFFEVTDYQGAFSSSVNWALGWTGMDALGHFVQPAAEGVVELVSYGKDGGNFNISFLTESDKTYKVTYSATLADDFANVVSGQTGINGTGSEVSRSFLIPNAASALFFRVEEE